MKVNIICAHDHNQVIGHQGKLPWGKDLPEDLVRFKKLTLGYPVIMGRKTWDSLPLQYRPLPGRSNIVLTRDRNWQADGAIRVNSMEDVYVRYKTAELIWVIGGAQVYQEAMGLAHKILATEIDAEYVGDTYLPRLDNRWKPDIGNWQVSVSGLRYRFVNWCRTHDR